MNPYPSRFDDPQRASDGMAFQDRQEIAQPPDDSLEGCPGSNLHDNNSGALFWRESRDLAEVTIEGNERSPLG